jgi:FkbM family methyltransferase
VTLVYDLGMHTGEDTAAYLAAGHRVVAVEAHPHLAYAARTRFAAELASGQLVIESVGVGDRRGTFTFWICDSHPIFSSFHERQAKRYGLDARPVKLQMVSFWELLDRYGCPDYLKIDIEGMDEAILSQLSLIEDRPRFVSVEGFGVRMVEQFENLGYHAFKWVNQRLLPPDTSGAFGDDLEGSWLTADETMVLLREFYDTGRFERPDNLDWYDLHAKMGD